MSTLLAIIGMRAPLVGAISIAALFLIMSVAANSDSDEEDLFDELFKEKKSKK